MVEQRKITRNPKRWNDGKSPEILEDGKSANIPREGMQMLRATDLRK